MNLSAMLSLMGIKMDENQLTDIMQEFSSFMERSKHIEQQNEEILTLLKREKNNVGIE